MSNGAKENDLQPYDLSKYMLILMGYLVVSWVVWLYGCKVVGSLGQKKLKILLREGLSLYYGRDGALLRERRRSTTGRVNLGLGQKKLVNFEVYQLFRLDYRDSNSVKQNQNLLCYHYTIVQTFCISYECGCKDTLFSRYSPIFPKYFSKTAKKTLTLHHNY